MTKFPINKNTLYYGLGLIMMKGIAFLMLPVYTHYLSTFEYGQLEIIVTYSNLVSLILGLGLIESLYRFAGGKSEQTQQMIMTNVTVLTVIISLLFLGFISIFASTVTKWLPGDIPVQYTSWISLSLCLGAIINIPLTWLRMREEARLFFIATIGIALIQSSLSFWMLHDGLGVMSILLSGVIATSLVLLVVTWQIRHDYIIQVDKGQLSRLVGYGWPFIISGFAGFILSGADRWILADVSDLETLAIYAIAAKFAFVPVMLMQPYALWWYPKRFNYLGDPDKLKTSAHYAVLGAAMAVALCGMTGLVAPTIIRIMTPVDYHLAINYLPAFLIAIALKICSEYLNIGCFINTQSYQQMAIDLGAAMIGLLAMAIMAKPMGIMGIIMALNLAYITRMLMFFIFSQRALHLPYKLMPLYSSAVISVGLLAAGQWLIKL